jgi:iron complex transport system substrate-binding protein
MRWVAAVICSVVIAAGGAGCKRGRSPQPASPSASRRLRVVSLAPSSTEILFALGAGDLLVGVDQFSDFPEAARKLPRVGNDLNPSVERIVGLHPDVVFAATSANSRDLVEQLGRLGIRVVVSRGDTFAEVWRDIGNVGEAVQQKEAATRLVASLRARMEAVAARAAGRPRPRTLVVVWTEPLTVAGGHSFVDEAIATAGGSNVAGDAPVPFPQYSLERLLARAPEVVIVGSHAAAPVMEPILGQSSLPAVKSQRVHRIDGDLLFRPGPRLVDGVEALAKLLHPER